MQSITTIGLDIAKSVFQVHGVDAAGQVVVRRQLKRRHVVTFFAQSGRCSSSSLSMRAGLLRQRAIVSPKWMAKPGARRLAQGQRS